MRPAARPRRCFGLAQLGVAELHALCFVAKRREDDDSDGHRACNDREGEGIIASIMRGDGRLQRGVDRRYQVAELIDKSRKGAAGLVRRQFEAQSATAPRR